MVISARGAARALGTVVAVLALLHVVGAAVRFGLHRESMFGLLPLTDLDVEQGFGTWFSGIAWLAAGGLAALLAHDKRRRGDPHAGAWRGLAVIFAYLSADEMLSIHELLNRVTRKLVPAEGIFYWSWWVLAVPIALAVALAYLRFLFALPMRYRRLFVTAGALFVSGAVGGELIESVVASGGGLNTAGYALLVLLEETLEMSGVVVLIYALISYAGEVGPSVGLRFEGVRGAIVPAAATVSAAAPARGFSAVGSDATGVAGNGHRAPASGAGGDASAGTSGGPGREG
jgi:hypothetical protein